MERGREFSSSEEFAKSLEPNFNRETHTHHKIHHQSLHSPSHKPNSPHKQSFQIPKIIVPRLHRSEPVQKSYDPHHHRRRKRFEVFAAFYLLLLLALIFFLSYSTDTGPFIVLLALTPTLFTVVIAMVIYEAAKDNKNILWVVPLVLIFGFHAYGSMQGGVVGSIDINVMTALNLMFSFLYLIINYFLLQSKVSGSKMKTKTIIKEVIKEVIKEKEVIPDDLSKFIASIEDKSKALNFVIGRVYNAYHGGTKELRLKINMRQEWYDQFSQIPSDPSKINFLELSALISTIESRLRLLEKSEVEIFGSDHKKFKNLVRDPSGREKVLEVLDKNDKDPVKNYVDGALQFCGEVKSFIKKREAPVVENKYVARPDENKKNAPRMSSLVDSKIVKK